MGASLAEVKARVSEALDPGKLGLNQKPLAFVNVIRLGRAVVWDCGLIRDI